LRNRAIALAAALLTASIAIPARAATRLYVIAIGNNSPPLTAAGEVPVERLRHADDDAASMAELGAELGAQVTVLSVLDAPSQRRFPNVARDARPPSLVELRKAVAWHRDRFERDRRAGNDPVLVFFYSGHGTRGGSAAPPSLALLDGPLTSSVLYDEILASLPARYVHILVDACHAEAVVRPRDLDAPSFAVSANEEKQILAKNSLARFPNVGAIMATASGAESHEWDAIEEGVFTHELISALRGAADVNGDGKIEYSEASAFFNAANRDVGDTRAKLSVLVHPPDVNGHAALTDLGWARAGARLEGSGRASQAFTVEDDRGLRLLDLRPEPGFRFALLLPTGHDLYVRSGSNEAEIHPSSRGAFSVDQLAWRPRDMRERGAVESSFRRGLFATPFGPTYYRGFVDARQELIPVAFSSRPRPEPALPVGPEPSRTDALVWTAFGGAAALTGVSIAYSVMAVDARNEAVNAVVERTATAAHDRLIVDRNVAIGTGIGAAAAVGLGIWRIYAIAPGPRSPSATVMVGPGHASAAVDFAW